MSSSRKLTARSATRKPDVLLNNNVKKKSARLVQAV